MSQTDYRYLTADWTLEQQVTAAICAPEKVWQQSAERDALLCGRVSPYEILTQAVEHRIRSVALRRIIDVMELQSADADSLFFFQTKLMDTNRKMRLRELGQLEVLEALHARNIDVMVVKGVSVAHLFYDVVMDREYRDSDLLVRPGDVAKATSVARELQYQLVGDKIELAGPQLDALLTMGNDLAFSRRDGQAIEIQWRLERNKAYLDWDYDSLLATSRTIDLHGFRVRVPLPPQQFILLCTHGAKHSWFRFRWLSDISRIVTTMSDDDWQQVLVLAQRTGVIRIVADALALVETVHRTRAPDWIRSQILPHSRRSGVDFAIRSQVKTDARHNLRLQDFAFVARRFQDKWTMKKGIRYKLSLFAQGITEPRDIPLVKLSSKFLLIYQIIAPLLAVKRLVARRSGKNSKG